MGLCVPQFIIFTVFVCHKLLMRAALNNLTVIKDDYVLAETAGGESVADIDGSLVFYYLIEF
mgnify:FL=1